MKNKRIIKIAIILALNLMLLTLLSSCKNAEEMGLDGLKKIFYPALGWFHGLFSWFSPSFWRWIGLAFKVNWIVGAVAGFLGGILYVVLIVLGIIVGVVFLIVACILWFLLAILNGIVHFTSW